MYLIQNMLIRFLTKIIGGNEMIFVTIFVSLIVAKRRNIDGVPAHLKADVLADLNAMGLDGYGNPIEVEEIV